MAVCPWNVIGGGHFQTKKQIEERKASGEGLRKFVGTEQSAHYEKISAALEEVGTEVGADIQAVAIAYVMHKQPYTFPLIGGRKIEHLMSNIKGARSPGCRCMLTRR
jgi:aryl-alcohol dehydrogenase-like predicted oxidoreductase